MQRQRNSGPRARRKAETRADGLKPSRVTQAEMKCEARRDAKRDATRRGMQAEMSAWSEFKASEIRERKERLGRAERMKREVRRDEGLKPR